MAEPIIPDHIVVHLGAPNDASAPNVRVPFVDYIKNVASSEIYPTWPESAIRANILAQITYALNRVYTEWYRSRGYDFDITASTAYDQKYIQDREVFDNISNIVDELFDTYIVRQGSIEPIFAQYCNGTTVTCDGLSQWGTVELAEQGKVPYEILQNYYGEDINLVTDAPISPNVPSYPGVLSRGEMGENIYTLQRQLNRIAQNYPAIGEDIVLDGVYGVQTENAVKNFQRIFGLTQDGVVGRATWYKVKAIYNAVKSLGELASEGLTYEEIAEFFPEEIAPGDSGINVRMVQFYLHFLATYDDTLSTLEETGYYDDSTRNAVRIFQQQRGLPATGVVDHVTWRSLIASYRAMIQTLPYSPQEARDELYPGYYLTPNDDDPAVRSLQRILIRANQKSPFMPPVEETGIYDRATYDAVIAAQHAAGIPENGLAGPVTWEFIADLARS